MSYHVVIELSDGWFAAKLLEDDSCYTQGKTLEEAVANMREVIELVRGEKRPDLEVIIPSKIKLKARARQKVRRQVG